MIPDEKSQSKGKNARKGERDLCNRNQVILIKSPTKGAAGTIRQQR